MKITSEKIVEMFIELSNHLPIVTTVLLEGSEEDVRPLYEALKPMVKEIDLDYFPLTVSEFVEAFNKARKRFSQSEEESNG